MVRLPENRGSSGHVSGGHEPQTDIALLEHGFHIMYCDVADMYGSPEAVKRWNRFYKMMVKQASGVRSCWKG